MTQNCLYTPTAIGYLFLWVCKGNMLNICNFSIILLRSSMLHPRKSLICDLFLSEDMDNGKKMWLVSGFMCYFLTVHMMPFTGDSAIKWQLVSWSMLVQAKTGCLIDTELSISETTADMKIRSCCLSVSVYIYIYPFLTICGLMPQYVHGHHWCGRWLVGILSCSCPNRQ